MSTVHVDSHGEILNLGLITEEKERAIKAEAWAEDEKMRADTISSRIQEVNDALLVAEALNKELRSIIYDIGVGWSKEDDGPITRALNRYNKMELEK